MLHLGIIFVPARVKHIAVWVMKRNQIFGFPDQGMHFFHNGFRKINQGLIGRLQSLELRTG